MEFEVKVRTEDEIGVVQLIGEVDVFTTPKAKEAMLGLIKQGVVKIAINLQDTEYLDSTGLGALVGVLKRAREHQGDVHLVNPTDRIRRVLEITGLIQVFTINNSEEEAIKALGQKEGSSQ